MTIADRAIKGKIHHPPPRASVNEMTIADRAIKGKIHHPPPGASVNEMTISKENYHHPLLKA